MDPFSGPDADNYYRVYLEFLRNGPFSPVDGVPFWQPGYPWFLLLLDHLSPGVGIRPLMVLQSMLTSITILVFRFFCISFLDKFQSNIIGILIAVNFGFFAASSQLMYESVLTFFSIIAIFSLFKASRENNFQVYRFFLLLLFYSTFLLSVFIQPKIVLVFFLVSLTLFGVRNFQLSRHLITAILISFSILLLRNFNAGLGVGISANFRTHIIVGTQKVYSDYHSNCDVSGNFDTLSSISCLLYERFLNFSIGAEVTFRNLYNFFAPYIGPLGDGKTGTGSWFHGINFRRLLPTDMRNEVLFYNIDLILSEIWMFSFLLAVMIGGYVSFSQSTREARFIRSMYMGFIGTMLPIIFGIGDSRYRLSAVPFYVAVVVFSLTNLYRRHLRSKWFSS